MSQYYSSNSPQQEGGGLSSCLMWLLWGGSLGIMTVIGLVLVVVLIGSLVLNVYLGWQLSGLEVFITRSGPGTVEDLPLPTDVLAAIPTNTPVPPTSTPNPAPPTLSPVEEQVATLSAIATEAAATQTAPVAGPVMLLTPTPAAVPQSEPSTGGNQSAAAPAGGNPAGETTAGETITMAETPSAQVAESPEQEFVPPATSSNNYDLIPIKGSRESRPAEEHGDLNLKLREPQPKETELALIDIDGSGIDPDAPNLAAIFEPNFVQAYTIHDWDWSCNCKGALLEEDHLVLLGIKTTPGEPVFIPTTPHAAYDGKYHATVLYASEDSLTFVYDNVGNVTTGYTIHYLGLQTDPNLLKLFQESKGNELPGLTLNTPVGWATDELIVAVRDKGTFMDARSRKDWWE